MTSYGHLWWDKMLPFLKYTWGWFPAPNDKQDSFPAACLSESSVLSSTPPTPNPPLPPPYSSHPLQYIVNNFRLLREHEGQLVYPSARQLWRFLNRNNPYFQSMLPRFSRPPIGCNNNESNVTTRGTGSCKALLKPEFWGRLSACK